MLTNLRDLYQHQLAELRQAEVKYLETLRTLQSAAYSDELGRMIYHQVQRMQKHIRRLDAIVKPNQPLQLEGTSAAASMAQVCLELSRHPKAFPDVRDARSPASAALEPGAEVLGGREASGVLQKCLSDEKSSPDLSRFAKDANQHAASALAVS